MIFWDVALTRRGTLSRLGRLDLEFGQHVLAGQGVTRCLPDEHAPRSIESYVRLGRVDGIA